MFQSTATCRTCAIGASAVIWCTTANTMQRRRTGRAARGRQSICLIELRPNPQGVLWNAEYVFPEKIVAVRRIDVLDLTGWEKVNHYTLTGGG